ncbi:transporter substrate-binding domain-containing protein [Romboutsia sp. CE17]|uniref:transporter substrate-binding domain-containing protein n=1 Tax=Romboutsia sp. CE17 TaxID=2724150 RepID=UPI001442DC81|nr:transporter substrate-binding domain-containing protein [Romboutsia sp. CE17]QJA08940.1 transporter substrate-binding domain-containing protein [Romboutsia sp. CE17]
MKLKKVLLGMLVGVLSLGFVACSSSEDKGSDAKATTQLEQVKEKGKLVIATSADYPPYEFHKEIDGKDTIVGFDIMIAEEIAKELGVELEIKDMKFDGLLPALQSGNVDMVVAGMTATEERQQAVNFTESYYNGEISILINKKDLDKYTTLESLKSVKIGAQKASLQENFAIETIEATNMKLLSKIPDLILELKNGNVDAVVVTKQSVTGYLKQYPELTYANVNTGEYGAEGAAIAIKKSDDLSLVEKSNEVLAKLKSENKIDEFVNKATELAQD